ncbi:aldolase [Pilatotrama ljubarskyi]|nr:aldolase [Pilatotrama ljubarskyi]
MPMLTDPSAKYDPYTPIDLPNRQWPKRRVERHPIWLSTDLRDGNQALARPMTTEQKRMFFRHLVSCNFKEIEVAYPSSSETEFEFVRSLIDGGDIPDDVWIQVMTPARAELIHRTFEAIAGARKVIISLFNATAPCFREVVFGKSKEEIIELATTHTKLVRSLVDEHREKYGAKFRLVYGVEAFSQTEPEYVVEICTAVKNAWGLAGKAMEDRIMYNLPSTVEIAPPNHYADQIEYFCTHMEDRDEIVVSLHTHNDRGTAVAATELGVLAGADRVEGCLFGNGERSGNVDLVTLALNLYTQGIPCGLNFSNIQDTIDIVTQCTSLPIHPRHPYAGELVFTAFSGSHQDAIKKGFEAQAVRHAKAAAEGLPLKWSIPYLPLDPADLGRTYEAVIRVNSQSGKGGIAYIIRKHLHIDLPRPVQQEFYRVVQRQVDRTAREMTADEIKATFTSYYHLDEEKFPARIVLSKFAVIQTVRDGHGVTTFQGRMTADGQSFTLRGEGSGPLVAFLAAVESRTRLRFAAVETHERASLDPTSGDIVSFVLLVETYPAPAIVNGESQTQVPTWGVGVDTDKARSLIRAAVSAMNKRLGNRPVAVVTGGTKEVLRILNDDYGLPVPRGMQDVLSELCTAGDVEGLSPEQVAARFVSQFCHMPEDAKGATLSSFSIAKVPFCSQLRFQAIITLHGSEKQVEAVGGDAVSCLLVGLGHLIGSVALREVQIVPRVQSAKGLRHVAFVQLESELQEAVYGIGIDDDMTTAMLQATLVAAGNCNGHRL